MAIGDYTPLTKTVSFNGGSFTMKGLSATDLLELAGQHLPAMEQLIDLVGDMMQDKPVDPNDALAGGLRLLDIAPKLVGMAIAIAADERESADKVLGLPLPVIVEAIQLLLELTLKDAGGPKKFVMTVVRLIQGLTGKSNKTSETTENPNPA